jgi:hypothetical protein
VQQVAAKRGEGLAAFPISVDLKRLLAMFGAAATGRRRPMYSKFMLAGAFAAGVLISVPALADEVLDGIAAMPAGIEDVRIGGTWEKDGKNGAYRLVITRTGGDSAIARLFVQWIEYPDGGEAKVQNTIEIKELADLKVDIVDYTSESDEEGLSVYIETIDPSGNADSNYELRITPDDYRFGPTSN